MTTIPVLDKGYVKLLRHSGSDADIAAAARVSRARQGEGPAHDVRLIRSLMQRGHTMPFEFAQLYFEVKCPLFVARQVRTHRTWSFIEQSRRYTKSEPEFYEPDMVRMPEGRVVYFQEMKQSEQAYAHLLASGVSPEMARILLPVSMYTTLVASVDAHNLMHYLRLRLDDAAQWEHRQYAEAILKLFQDVLPDTAAAFMETMQ